MSKTKMSFSFLQKTSRFIIIALLSLTLTLTLVPRSFAQFPLPISSSSEGIPQLPRWDPNKAKQCGKFWCSNIFFYGSKRLLLFEPFKSDLATLIAPPKNVKRIQQEFTLGALILNPNNPEQSNQQTSFALGQRAKLVQDVFKSIFFKIINTQPKFPLSHQKDWHFWGLAAQKPLHPLTPS